MHIHLLLTHTAFIIVSQVISPKGEFYLKP
jgi:hypothetical protein